MRYQIVLETSNEQDLSMYGEDFSGQFRQVVGRPRTEDPEEVFGHARELAAEWFVSDKLPQDWYWHNSPEPTGGYFAQYTTGNTITIEEVRITA